MLEPDAGRFLWFLTQAVGARTIVEIGTSRGVSTLWLADAAQSTGGHVLSIDLDAAAQQDARRSVVEAGLADQVTFRVEDGGTALAGLPDGSVDLLFLDAERTEYPSWWPHPARVLRVGGVLVADNALSHAGGDRPAARPDRAGRAADHHHDRRGQGRAAGAAAVSETVIAVSARCRWVIGPLGRVQRRFDHRLTRPNSDHRGADGRARRWARSPCLPNRLRNSTASRSAGPNQCGMRVSNSAASPGFSTRSWSPSTIRRRPLRT